MYMLCQQALFHVLSVLFDENIVTLKYSVERIPPPKSTNIVKVKKTHTVTSCISVGNKMFRIFPGHSNAFSNLDA